MNLNMAEMIGKPYPHELLQEDGLYADFQCFHVHIYKYALCRKSWRKRILIWKFVRES